MEETPDDVRPVTLQDIADAVGVSRMTVSMALRNHPGLSDTTRGKVLAAAAKLDYRPNAFAAYLSRQRRSGGGSVHHANLALLAGHHDRDHRAILPGYRQAIGAAVARAKTLGYTMDDFWAFDPERSPSALARMLAWRSVRGVVFLSFLPGDFDALPLPYERLSMVHASSASRLARCHYAAVDYYAGMRLLLAKLRGLGYEKIGLSVTRGNNETLEERLTAAFLQYRAVGGQGFLHIDRAPRDLVRNRNSFIAWVRKVRPDAVIAWSSVGFDYLNWLKEARPEGDFPFFDLNVGFHSSRNLPGLAEPHAEMASAAVDKLVALIQHNSTGFPATPEQITFVPKLVGF